LSLLGLCFDVLTIAGRLPLHVDNVKLVKHNLMLFQTNKPLPPGNNIFPCGIQYINVRIYGSILI